MGSVVQTVHKSPQAAEAEAEGAQFLTFRLGAELYAVGIAAIKEIIEFGSVTAVPMMPEFIRGVINVRGAVVPVIDLLARFGKGVSQATKRTCIVIVELDCDGETQCVGVMVDAVNEVLEIAAADIEPAPSFGAGLRADFIAGMAKVAGRFIVLLDIGRVLSVDEIAMLAQASGQSHAAAAFAGAAA